MKETCHENFCLNGGTCQVVKKIAQCLCKEGFSGDHCDIGTIFRILTNLFVLCCFFLEIYGYIFFESIYLLDFIVHCFNTEDCSAGQSCTTGRYCKSSPG